ncbi:MAG: Uma2 family endonuclease [Bacteroidales bacterium]|nr:Uma2 family endonuclease [Bacteroidales bacterium]
MNANVSTTPIVYPDSDGRRMAENTLQAEWIMTIFGNLTLLFADRSDVFVAMDNLWYPVEGNPKRRVAPDVYVVFGRPKGHRGSYKQWEEDGIPLQVVFEVMSPGNRYGEMIRKFKFYETYGVDEYYVIDPDRQILEAWHRTGQHLIKVRIQGALTSPRMGIRFEWQPGSNVILRYPDGRNFLSFLELGAERDRIEQEHNRIEQERDRIEQERDQIEQERNQIEQERDQIEQELASTQKQAALLAAKLRELGLDPDTLR